MADEMRQYAPFPAVLAKLVENLRYRPGWHFELKDIERDHADSHGGAAGGLTFIGITGDYEGPDRSFRGAMDAYHPDRPRPVYFYFPVPAATYNEASWKRWLFERILEVERHEAMEHFALVEDVPGVESPTGGAAVSLVRPFAPTHGPGDDPYIVHEYGSDTQRRTAFTGRLNDA
jgi:hypothetical protein